MKSGMIVYLVGGAQLPEDFDLTGYCRQMGYGADRVELVGGSEGFFDVQDAWHHLYVNGCADISLLVAQTDQACLQPLHPVVRLSG
jgi:hypothetical protein